MNTDNLHLPETRSLSTIFREHLDNSAKCCQTLNDLFMDLDNPLTYIEKIKQLEEYGDKLTAEAYYSLDSLEYSELIRIIEELVKHLDDITDGLNNTARLIDICQPKQFEVAAHDILLDIKAMIEGLQTELHQFPDNNLASLRACCHLLKRYEENVDLIYHEWRKKQRRVLVLSLIEENNWTEILGVLEQMSDTVYHASLLLERSGRFCVKNNSTLIKEFFAEIKG